MAVKWRGLGVRWGGGGARVEGRMKGLRIRSIIEEDKHRAIVAEDIQLRVHMHWGICLCICVRLWI